ncbi:hypothetical protein A6E02_19180 [Aliivibrio fischeri]|nr:hypothetical protein A6E02_19180 [Aliivibrio fischeri]
MWTPLVAFFVEFKPYTLKGRESIHLDRFASIRAKKPKFQASGRSKAELRGDRCDYSECAQSPPFTKGRVREGLLR